MDFFGCWGTLVYVSICLPNSNVITDALGYCACLVNNVYLLFVVPPLPKHYLNCTAILILLRYNVLLSIIGWHFSHLEHYQSHFYLYFRLTFCLLFVSEKIVSQWTARKHNNMMTHAGQIGKWKQVFWNNRESTHTIGGVKHKSSF